MSLALCEVLKSLKCCKKKFNKIFATFLLSSLLTQNIFFFIVYLTADFVMLSQDQGDCSDLLEYASAFLCSNFSSLTNEHFLSTETDQVIVKYLRNALQNISSNDIHRALCLIWNTKI